MLEITIKVSFAVNFCMDICILLTRLMFVDLFAAGRSIKENHLYH